MAVTPRTIVRPSSRNAVFRSLTHGAAALRSVAVSSAALVRDFALTGQLGRDYEQRIGRHTGARC